MDFIVNQCGLRSEMPDNVQLVTPSYQEYVQRYNRRYFITDKGTDRQLERRDFHIRRWLHNKERLIMRRDVDEMIVAYSEIVMEISNNQKTSIRRFVILDEV